ncbi:MAG: hypothetical protein FWD35_05590, partial [Oscillospiraceae bacterium]|nr:hypothetical protein [Oscillospiraceae bacterium]
MRSFTKTIAILLTLAITLSACTPLPPHDNTDGSETSASSAAEPTTTSDSPTPEPPPPPPPPENHRVSFLATGDNLVHTPIFTQGAKHG